MKKQPLTFSAFSILNYQRASTWHKNGIGEWSIADWAVAMMGEAGEACNIIKKYNRVRDSLHSNNPKPFDKEQLGEELADTFIYLDLLATRCGFSLEEIVIAKFNKISKRERLPHRL